MPSVVLGYCIWTVATGLKCMFNRSTPLSHIIGILIIEGVGIGMTLQPSSSMSPGLVCHIVTDHAIVALIGLLANNKTEDRAVLTGLRNFMRTVGGASGLTSMSHYLPLVNTSHN